MKNLLYLLILIMLLFPTTINSAPSKENNKSAIEALEQANQLLKEEEQRWQTIHNNPVTDVWEVKKDGENLIINVTIDDSVKNIINDKPIQRKYTLIPAEYKLWAPCDLMVGGSMLYSVGWRPTVGLGYTPTWSKGFGVTVNTTFMNINTGVYYTNKKIPYLFGQILIGVVYTGQLTFGAGIGIKI